LAPLTPAPPKKRLHQRQQNPIPVPKTPVPVPGTFASRQIQGSNRRLAQRAAAVLFTPRTPHTPIIQHPRGQVPNQPSPTPQPRPARSLAQPSSFSGSSSDSTEDDVREGLERLNLEPRSTGSDSRSQSPRAGRHSKQARVPPKGRNAKDVWTFFEKAGDRRSCILCRLFLIFLYIFL
jgi:hypothetical protein